MSKVVEQVEQLMSTEDIKARDDAMEMREGQAKAAEELATRGSERMMRKDIGTLHFYRKKLLEIGLGRYMIGRKARVGVALQRAAGEVLGAIDEIHGLLEDYEYNRTQKGGHNDNSSR